jgi:hypothetical protein
MCPALGVLKPLPASGGFSSHPHHRRAFLASFFIIGNVYRSLKVQKKFGEMQIVVGGYFEKLCLPKHTNVIYFNRLINSLGKVHALILV